MATARKINPVHRVAIDYLFDKIVALEQDLDDDWLSDKGKDKIREKIKSITNTILVLQKRK